MPIEVINQCHNIEFIPEQDKILKLLEDAGRTCYKSEPKGDPEGFINRIMKSGHHSVIEHINITVRFITDRGVTHELVRHRLASYSQESTRYCRYAGSMQFIRPIWVSRNTLGRWFSRGEVNSHNELSITDMVWLCSCNQTSYDYQQLLEYGWKAQQARQVLNHSLKTEIVMTCNLREWLHVLNLRFSEKAHPQINELMRPLKQELSNKLPVIFKN